MEQSTGGIQELPKELAERLHRLALAETSESRPWPGVERAVQRAHRRRLAGVSAAGVACVLIIGMTFSSALGLSSDRGQSAPPAKTPPATTAPVSTEPPAGSGLAGPVGGSLGGDEAWLKQVRTRVAELADAGSANSRETKIMELTGTADDVQVAWTSELDGYRMAYTVYPSGIPGSSLGTFYVAAVLIGPAGAPAEQLNFTEGSGKGGSEPGATSAMFITRGDSDYPDLLLIQAPPEVTAVGVASTRKYKLDGTFATTWRPVRREGGSIWVTTLTPGEGYLSELRFVGLTNGGYGFSGHNFPALGRQAAAIAPAGSNRATVEFAGAALGRFKPSLTEQAVLSTGRRLTDTANLAATVFRSPDGVALVGFAERDLKFKATSIRRVQMLAGIPKQPLGDPDTFMIALAAKNWKGNAGYLVLTPTGATSARIGDVTVPVTNRLARFERGSTPTGSVTVEALDAQGKVIKTVVSMNGK